MSHAGLYSPATEHHSPLFGQYSFPIPLRIGDQVGLRGWLRYRSSMHAKDGHPSQDRLCVEYRYSNFIDQDQRATTKPRHHVCVCVHFTAAAVLWRCRLDGKKIEWWDAGMVICLERGADLHMSQLMPLPLPLTISFSSIFRLVLPSWFYLSGAGSPE